MIALAPDIHLGHVRPELRSQRRPEISRKDAANARGIERITRFDLEVYGRRARAGGTRGEGECCSEETRDDPPHALMIG